MTPKLIVARLREAFGFDWPRIEAAHWVCGIHLRFRYPGWNVPDGWKWRETGDEARRIVMARIDNSFSAIFQPTKERPMENGQQAQEQAQQPQGEAAKIDTGAQQEQQPAPIGANTGTLAGAGDGEHGLGVDAPEPAAANAVQGTESVSNQIKDVAGEVRMGLTAEAAGKIADARSVLAKFEHYVSTEVHDLAAATHAELTRILDSLKSHFKS